jgi:shikimate dehydrogenase
MVKGTTNLVGIIGDPVGHSLSPLMHNSAFGSLGLDWLYVPLPVKQEYIEPALKGLHALGFRGANVTVPHKERVIPFLDELSEHASRIRAVNTIQVTPDGRLIGENTDWSGFLNHLKDLGFDPAGSEALILGSGGSARAVGYALARSHAKVTLCSRNTRAAENLASDIGNFFPTHAPATRPTQWLTKPDVEIHLIVNTTPLGMSPDTGSSPWPEGVDFPGCKLVYDLVYNPPVTRLMEQARSKGIEAANGLEMLVYQAALAFEIWTGASAPVEIMKQAAGIC